MNYRCYQTSLLVKHFYTNRDRCEVLTGYLSLGAGLAVTGRIRDIGQNVLPSSFQTENGSSPSYFHIVFLIAFIEENCSNYTYLLTYLLTPWSRVLEKLTGSAVKKFPAFYGTRKFITIFTIARHLSLS